MSSRTMIISLVKVILFNGKRTDVSMMRYGNPAKILSKEAMIKEFLWIDHVAPYVSTYEIHQF